MPAAGPCPDWCAVTHDDLIVSHHTKSITADGVAVALIQHPEVWQGTPRVHLVDYQAPYQGDLPATFIVEPSQAYGLAAMMARLGHPELAAAITRTAKLA